jgi:hypothetical protein
MKWLGGPALLAALLLGTPGLAQPSEGESILVELCVGGHPARWILLSPETDRNGPPPGGCHAVCGIVSERRQTLRR